MSQLLPSLNEGDLELNYAAAIAKSQIVPETGCRVPRPGMISRINGKYPQQPVYYKGPDYHQLTTRGTQRKPRMHKNVRGAPRRVALHVLSYYYHHRELPVSSALDISHLCHNRDCFNVEHLVLEKHSMNWKRMGCPAGNLCTHNPKCLHRHEMQ